jgi:hypothetical protein
VGQRTFETRSLYLILAEKLFTLPAANEMLPLSALFAGKYREVGMASGNRGGKASSAKHVLWALAGPNQKVFTSI